MPEISVILPVYNGGKYLKESVESILDQSLPNFELLILDDCSSDGSWDYIQSISDKRVIALKNETNKGLFFNLNFLIKKSNSTLIKLWSQDDVMTEKALEKIVAFHQQYPAVGFSYTGVSYINENSKEILKPNKKDATPVVINSDIHANICFHTGSIAGNIANVTLTNKALQKVGLFNESMMICGDFDMWVRIAEFFEIGFIKEPLIILRDHTGQLSKQGKYYYKHIQEDIMVYKRLFAYLPEKSRKRGRNLLRNHKLVFYYTLMLRSLMKGDVSTASSFWKGINDLDNGFIMLFYFLKNKLFIPRQVEKRLQDNRWLMSN